MLWCWRQDLISAQPSHEVRVLMEAICIEELVKHYTFGWQTVETVVLVILVAKFVYTNTVTAQGLIFLLNVELAPFALVPTKFENRLLHFVDHDSFNLVH